MNNTLNYNHTVNFGEIDTAYRLRFDYIISLFQTATLFHSTELTVDAPTLAKTSNAFWVLTKSKFKILNLPKINDNITVETWPLPVTPIRFVREYTIKTNNEVNIVGSSEWVTLDLTTRSLRRSDSIKYPYDLEHRTDVSGAGDFTKKRYTTLDSDYVYTHQAKFIDIDPNEHVNNVAYVKMALNAFTVEEFNALNFTEFEIQYLTETYYGNEIKIYKKQIENGYIVEGKKDGKTVFISILK